MLHKFGDENVQMPKDESDESMIAEEKDWKYIRVPGLGFLPGLICPHHDKIQSNGILRAIDFDKMLCRHKGERGIGIDHWAVLIISNGKYEVLSLEDKVGLVVFNGKNAKFVVGEGVPGVWIKGVMEDGDVNVRLCPSEGDLIDLLRPAVEIVQDDNIELCRIANPSD